MVKKNKDKKMIVENSDVSPAAASLHPGAAPSDGRDFDPSKSEMMAQALQLMGGMSKDDINGFIASLAQAAHAADPIPGNAAAHNLGTLSTKPSAAVAEEDISALFEGQEVSEEFISQATKIFEAALETRLALEVTNLQEQYEELVNEAYETLSEEMSDKLDQYLNYAISEWMEDNRLVIDSGVRNEIMESFVNGLKNLFSEHYIDVPEDQVDFVKELSAKVADLEAKLNDAINENIALSESVKQTYATAIFESVASDLSEAAAKRLAVIAENVEFNSPEDFEMKLNMLKESVTAPAVMRKKRATTGMLNEDVFLTENEQKEMNESENPYARYISKTSKKA